MRNMSTGWKDLNIGGLALYCLNTHLVLGNFVSILRLAQSRRSKRPSMRDT